MANDLIDQPVIFSWEKVNLPSFMGSSISHWKFTISKNGDRSFGDFELAFLGNSVFIVHDFVEFPNFNSFVSAEGNEFTVESIEVDAENPCFVAIERVNCIKGSNICDEDVVLLGKADDQVLFFFINTHLHNLVGVLFVYNFCSRLQIPNNQIVVLTWRCNDSLWWRYLCIYDLCCVAPVCLQMLPLLRWP